MEEKKRFIISNQAKAKSGKMRGESVGKISGLIILVILEFYDF